MNSPQHVTMFIEKRFTKGTSLRNRSYVVVWYEHEVAIVGAISHLARWDP